MSSIIDFDTVSFIFLLWSCDQAHVEIWVIEKRTIICSRKISPVPRRALPAQLDTTAIGITSRYFTWSTEPDLQQTRRTRHYSNRSSP